MLSEEDIHRTGYESRASLVSEMQFAYSLTDHPYIRKLAGTTLHLLGESDWVEEQAKRFDRERFEYE